jgi:hypothetical protein
MKINHTAAIVAAAVALSGCATIVEGTTQSVSVNSTPVDGAKCTLVNSQGTWYVTTPGSTTVHKTKTDLDVTCEKPGYQSGHSVAVSHFGATTAANVIAGGLIGVGVDAASGANYHYDSPIMVPLGAQSADAQSPAATPSAAAPATPAGAAPAATK